MTNKLQRSISNKHNINGLNKKKIKGQKKESMRRVTQKTPNLLGVLLINI